MKTIVSFILTFVILFVALVIGYTLLCGGGVFENAIHFAHTAQYATQQGAQLLGK